MSNADTDPAAEAVDVKTIWLTVAIATGAIVLAHVALLVNFMHDSGAKPENEWNMPWQPVVALALSVTSLVTFGGFYIAARRARIAITASFLLTFLSMLPFALTIRQLGEGQNDFAKSLMDQFGGVVSTVVIFYFGSEAAITGIKLWKTASNPEAAVELANADSDLPPAPVNPPVGTN